MKRAQKKIVIINQDSGYLMIDIANAFVEKYDKVVFLTGKITQLKVKLSDRVRVRKITRYNRKNTFTRSFSWIWGFIQTAFLLNIIYRRYEVFATSNPPLLNLLPLVCPNKISLLVYDVYPDGLVAGNFISEKSLINRSWKKLNRKSFAHLHSILTITEGMADALSKYIDKEKIKIIPVWSGNYTSFEIIPSKNLFLQHYNLHDKFLVVYSGNLGLGYNIEMLVHLAERMKGDDRIRILIVGNGFKKKAIEALITNLELSNCLTLPYQQSEFFSHLLAATSVGIVSLEQNATSLAIPSKTYNLMGAGKPIVCLGSKKSDLASMIKKYTIGATFEEKELGSFVDFIDKLMSDKAYYSELSDNARNTSKLFTSKNAHQMVEIHISQSSDEN